MRIRHYEAETQIPQQISLTPETIQADKYDYHFPKRLKKKKLNQIQGFGLTSVPQDFTEIINDTFSTDIIVKKQNIQVTVKKQVIEIVDFEQEL